MSLGSNSFCYKSFHAYYVSGRFWNYTNLFIYDMEKVYFYLHKCSQKKERYEHTHMNYINILRERNPGCRFKSQN